MYAAMENEQKYPGLFSPIDIGRVRLKNRLVHASITTCFTRNGGVSDSLLNYCASRAAGGAAAIILEPTNMHAGQTDPRRADVFNGGNRDALKRLVEAVERQDCRLLGQVQDSGRGRRELGRNDAAIGASPLPDDLSWTVPHALSTGEIRQLVEEFTKSCGLLREAGFAGVEISAGHGHLFHQFMSSWSNQRDDEYGGDVTGRTLFTRELIESIRSECGTGFVIGVKLPGDDGVKGSIDIDEAHRIAMAVAATGEVDYWTFCRGTHADTLFEHVPDAHGERTPYAREIAALRQAAPTIPTGALGYITDPNEAERVLNDGTADLVMLGRSLITDPGWGRKAEQGREAEIRYCVSCNTCWRTIIETGRLECDNNPRVGKLDETDWWPALAKKRKKIVIVGAGIAGMEAAWVAGARGHEVTVLGKGREVGGKTRLHAGLPGGENLSSIYDYQLLAANRGEVTLEMGMEADISAIQAYGPDVVVLATGSRMGWPDFLPQAYREDDFFPDLRQLVADFSHRVRRESGRIVIYDKDHTEMTYAAAEFFAGIFDEVVLITPRERIASDVSLINRQGIYRRLFQKRVRIITSSEPCSDSALDEGRLAIANIYNLDRSEINDIAALTYATARVPNDQLSYPLRARGLDVRVIGDCYAPRSVLAATREGHALGNAL
jgi:2,4-dienoyl-CoA reductase-like NADH-dependent reductase (Old Yellow Enzyme family)/thioredoxin reductase